MEKSVFYKITEYLYGKSIFTPSIRIRMDEKIKVLTITSVYLRLGHGNPKWKC